MEQPALPLRVRVFVLVSSLLGGAILLWALLQTRPADPLKFACYLAVAVLSATLKVWLPGMESTMSVHFLFVLLGVLELSLGETLAIGCGATLMQSFWRPKRRPEAIKVLYNVLGMSAPAIFLTYSVYRWSSQHLQHSTPVLLLIAACTYFYCNTAPVSVVIALSEKISVRKIWKETYFWSLPYYLIGAAVVGMISLMTRFIGWQSALAVLPLMYGVYRSYHLYLGRLDDEKKRVEIEARQVDAERRHVEEMCALHLRTIEGLALAIEAKDQNTHSHLHRVRTFAVELGKELGLGTEDLDALRAAALLHDIGKLAVPDHIINKPGRLTPEEYEKMKIHPVVGAEIIEKVAFPYPVAPIVRSHHERWDGSGYPDGLKGEEIPLGARILAVVDCLDGLTSHRQYRQALLLDEAMQTIVEDTGTAFDPAVVAVLERRYKDLEGFARRSLEQTSEDALRFRYSVPPGETPANGLKSEGVSRDGNRTDFLTSIASARQEAHTLFELSQDLGNSLSLDETLSLVALRLRKLVPYDALGTFVLRDEALVPEFATGDTARTAMRWHIPLGEGLCGWVAQHGRPILNGDPAAETGVAGADAAAANLRSALVVPLEGVSGLVGVLALYQTESDAFTTEHLRVLQVVTARVALFIENALRYRAAEHSATIDHLTGMANARALSLHLDQELARCQREQTTMAVMVCDLNGFKEVNDRYGHLAGDRVLKLFADSVRKVCRPYDYAARMGGDEFVIIATKLPPSAIKERALLLSALAEAAGRDVCGRSFLSLSLGAAFYPDDGHTVEELLAEADRRMYAVKTIHHDSAATLPSTDTPRTEEAICLQ